MRRRKQTKRALLPDPKFNSVLITKFVHALMKHGKKSIAFGIVYRVLDAVGERYKGGADQSRKNENTQRNDHDAVQQISSAHAGHLIELFTRALDNVCPAVEVRARRVGGSTYQIPTEVRPERRTKLGLKNLIEAARKRSEKGMVARLVAELLDALDGKGAAVKKREDMHRMAKANQAFAHFRWN